MTYILFYNIVLTYNIICRIICIVKQYYITKQKNNLVPDRGDAMIFNTGAALLDAIVLAVVSRDIDGTYGYKITQDIREAIDISESTLYPVLRRLQKEGCLEVYDLAIDGRNRRYYRITESGRLQLNLYRGEWSNYSQKISKILEGAD